MPVLKTPRHETIAQRLSLNESQVTIERELGLSKGYIHKLLSRNVRIKDRIAEIKDRVTAKVEYSAAKALSRLTELVELKVSDFDKPRDQWTETMERWGFDDIPITERSNDGQTKDKAGGWDIVGKRTRIRVADKLKALELIGKYKSIDAYVQQKTGDTNNYLVITAERAREVVAARRRLESAPETVTLDVIPKEPDTT